MIVYQITCEPTGKVYIGITRFSTEKRWREHWNSARRRPHSVLPMYVDMRAHSKNLWKIEVVATGANYDDLLRLEREIIAKVKSTDPTIGYNRTIGGQGVTGNRYKKTPEQIEKSARHHRGKKLPPERVATLRKQLAWMNTLPRPQQGDPRRDAKIMVDYFSSPSLESTGKRFGIKAPAVSMALKRCRDRLCDNLSAMRPLYEGIVMPQRIHPDHLEP